MRENSLILLDANRGMDVANCRRPEDEDMNVKSILVPLDGSISAEAALTPAVDLARDKAARLVLLRAAEAHTLVADPTEAQVAAVREAEEYLASLRARVERGGGVETVDVAVWYGPPAEAIAEAAMYRKVDLIVMSSHGRSGLGRLVLGSVAETVLRSTTVPILLIRPGNAPLDAPYMPAPAESEASHV
jgi:nucleotide-binding universal stress UspA family protein